MIGRLFDRLQLRKRISLRVHFAFHQAQAAPRNNGPNTFWIQANARRTLKQRSPATGNMSRKRCLHMKAKNAKDAKDVADVT